MGSSERGGSGLRTTNHRPFNLGFPNCKMGSVRTDSSGLLLGLRLVVVGGKSEQSAQTWEFIC